VEFAALDGVRIAGDFRGPRKGAPLFLALHGLGAGRGEWAKFSELSGGRGWGLLAIDGRGHGESGGPRYTGFRGPGDWGQLERDLLGAFIFLDREGVSETDVVLAGASIGANIALRAAVRKKGVPFALLLSPGYDYQGIRLPDPVAAFDRPMLLAASKSDAYAWKSSEAALRAAEHRGSRLLEAASGHGVGMLDGKPNAPFTDELMDTIQKMWRAAREKRKKARKEERRKSYLRRDPKAQE